ncbi:glycosyltransferase family protein [Haliea sp. E17]|uniref:glycosyltransferase family protein n=1 Tax=Haliea sp. E17 TaxID=3401576 RepID=UPI003AAA89FB
MKLLKERGLTWGGLFRLLATNIREGGLQVTLRKALSHLRSTSRFSIDRYTRWYERHQLGDAGAAPAVFRGQGVVIIGALDIPQCKKYRVLQKVEYFTARGIPCAYAEFRDLHRAFSLMQLASTVIFYRIPRWDECEALVAEAERLGLSMYYDIDDPIFDRDCYAQNRNLETLSARERDGLLAQIPSYAAMMQRVGRVIVSTRAMQALAQQRLQLQQVVLWPNLVDGAMLSVYASLPPAPVRSGDAVWLGYFSGSRAHDQDFASIVPVLARLLEQFPQLHLRLGGFVSAPEALLAFADRVVTSSFQSTAVYLETLRSIDINLVPLLRDAFNDCKSAIRYLEASLCGVVTVADRIGQFADLVSHAETGMLCDSEAAWQQALQQLIEDPALRDRLARAAQRQVLETQCLDAPAWSGLAAELGVGVAHG